MKKSIMGFAALVMIATAAFAFTNVTHKAPIVYYQYSGVQPPTAGSVTTVGNWTSIASAPTYTSGTKLYFIEFDAATTNITDAETILSSHLPLADNQSYSQSFNGVQETVKVHLQR